MTTLIYDIEVYCDYFLVSFLNRLVKKARPQSKRGLA